MMAVNTMLLLGWRWQRGKLTSKRETPEVADVDEPDEERQTCHLPTFEQQAVALDLEHQLLHQRQRALLVTGAEQLIATPSRLVLSGECLEVLQCNSTFALVDFGDVLEDSNRLRVLAPVDKELGRLLEVEDDKSQEENEQRHCTEREHQVAPAHVVRLATAWLSRRSDVA